MQGRSGLEYRYDLVFILRVGITISHDGVKQFFLRFIQEVKVFKSD
jgi:hypothetical protein